MFFLENLYFSSFLRDSFAGYNICGRCVVAVAAAAATASGLCITHPTIALKNIFSN